MSNNQKIHYTSSGEEVVIRPEPVTLWGQTIIQSIWVAGVGILLYWSGPAIVTYFQDGEITGALRRLEPFSLSPRAVLISVIAWCVFLTWWGVGGLYEILKVQLQRDRFILRSDALVVHRRSIASREYVFPIHEPFALRLRPLDGALEATTSRGSTVLTRLGNSADRSWLLELLQKRYRAPNELPVVTETAKERVATYVVERFPGGILRISSSGLASYGCTVLAAVLCAILASVGVWLFTKGSGAGIIPFMFFIAIAFAGLGALNRRNVEASRERLQVQWTSPVGKLLSKFLPSDSPVLRANFGEGRYEATSGTFAVRTTFAQKGSPTHRIVLLQEMKAEENESLAPVETAEEAPGAEVEEEVDEEDLDFVDDPRMESLVLTISGADTRTAADHIVRLLSEATGFAKEEVKEEE